MYYFPVVTKRKPLIRLHPVGERRLKLALDCQTYTVTRPSS